MIEFLYLLLFVFLFRCFDLCRFSFAAGFPGNGPPRRGRPSKRAWLANAHAKIRALHSAISDRLSEPVFPREISPCINLFLPTSLIDLDIFSLSSRSLGPSPPSFCRGSNNQERDSWRSRLLSLPSGGLSFSSRGLSRARPAAAAAAALPQDRAGFLFSSLAVCGSAM